MSKIEQCQEFKAPTKLQLKKALLLEKQKKDKVRKLISRMSINQIHDLLDMAITEIKKRGGE